jgi:hypothetical protein
LFGTCRRKFVKRAVARLQTVVNVHNPPLRCVDLVSAGGGISPRLADQTTRLASIGHRPPKIMLRCPLTQTLLKFGVQAIKLSSIYKTIHGV